MPSIPSVPLMRASPSFSASSTGAIPAPAKRLRRRDQRAAGVADLALAHQGQRAVGQRRQVARAAQRPELVHHGRQSRAEQLRVGRRGLAPHPGVAGGHRRQAQQHQRPHHLALHLVSRSGGMAADERALKLAAALVGDVPAGQRPEPGRHAVVRPDVLGEGIDRAPPDVDRGEGLIRQPHRRAAPGDRDDLARREGAHAHGDGALPALHCPVVCASLRTAGVPGINVPPQRTSTTATRLRSRRVSDPPKRGSQQGQRCPDAREASGHRAFGCGSIEAMANTPNVYEQQFEYDDADPPGYRSGVTRIGALAGGKDNVIKEFEIPPGESICPYHYEYEEEWLLVLDGRRHPPHARRGADARARRAGLLPRRARRRPQGHQRRRARRRWPSCGQAPASRRWPSTPTATRWASGRAMTTCSLRRADGNVDYYDGER